jgi:hypothetical protein
MSLDTTIDALRTVVDTIADLHVYPDPPESINQFPSAIVYSRSGTLQFGSATLTRNYHTLAVDIYHARQVLPQSVDSAKVWPDLVYDAISTAQRAGTIDVVSANGRSEIEYITGPMTYNTIQHFGVRFTVRIKEVVSG